MQECMQSLEVEWECFHVQGPHYEPNQACSLEGAGRSLSTAIKVLKGLREVTHIGSSQLGSVFANTKKKKTNKTNSNEYEMNPPVGETTC